ncbi:MCPH1 protein, partial [Glaucidium brasilianum]|nr:MCPH1 protein [Glaucidium brasilianum]
LLLQVSKTLNKRVTHVVFKDGHLATWRKAQKMGVKIVSVLWVEKCRETGVHVDESLFSAVDTNEGLPLLSRKHKCMQPKDFVEKTPENNRKLRRRLDQMAKELAIQKIAINAETDVPVLLFEDNGSLVFSPVKKEQCSVMERRVREMKEKREDLSPATLEMSLPPSSSPRDSLLSNCVVTNSEDALLSEQMEDCLNSSYYLCGTDTLKMEKTDIEKHACDTWTDLHVSRSASVNSPSHSYEQNLTPEQHSRSLTKKQVLLHTLGDKLPSERKELKKFPKKNQKDKNSTTTSVANKMSLLHIKGLGHTTYSKKKVKLNTVPAFICSLNSSPMNSEDLNTCSLDRSFPADKNDCILDKKRKKGPTLSSLKLAASELDASGSEEFLQAITTCNKSFCTEESSYEDFFSSSDLNENKVHVQVPKESQSSPEVCCKDSFTGMDLLNVRFSMPHTNSKKSRKKSFPTNDVSVEKNFKPAEHRGSMPLNYMSDGEKADTAECLEFDDVNRLPQQAHEKSYRTSVNYCTHTTG